MSKAQQPAAVTTDVTIDHEHGKRLGPEFMYNLCDALNAGTRMVKHVCEGGDRFVVGVDALATKVLEQQAQRIASQIAASAPKKSLPAK